MKKKNMKRLKVKEVFRDYQNGQDYFGVGSKEKFPAILYVKDPKTPEYHNREWIARQKEVDETLAENNPKRVFKVKFNGIWYTRVLLSVNNQLEEI